MMLPSSLKTISFVNGTDQVQFAAIQVIKLSNAYCGEWWIDHPVTGKKSALLV